ncbi:MAG: hypothetical protein CVV42_18205 [Candidatus Riflebacteria bacterium HGW-Riflebacteria-2]|jgi:hypothetical protein|nr:MAG: hypothetical protein CVV42_18205 [Candidatus Riflebacteria bacterium HGW-Riflebacteria-2]
MTKIIVIILALVAAVPAAFGAEAAVAASSEAGVFVAGSFTGVSATPDGSIYLLGRDHRIVKLSPDGQQQSMPLPAVEGTGEDSYLCDMAAGENQLAFCGYAYSGIYVLDLNKPEKLDFIKVAVENLPVNLLMVARSGDSWCVKDADERVIQVAADGTLKHLPQYAAIETDKYGKAVIIPPPRDMGDKIVYPGNVFREDGQPLWIAPSAEAPREIMSVEYLGCDKDQRDIFMVTTASGELDAETSLFAVKHSKVVARRAIPQPTAMGVMRYCRLAPDGSVLILLADPNEREGVLIKRISLTTTQASEG